MSRSVSQQRNPGVEREPEPACILNLFSGSSPSIKKRLTNRRQAMLVKPLSAGIRLEVGPHTRRRRKRSCSFLELLRHRSKSADFKKNVSMIGPPSKQYGPTRRKKAGECGSILRVHDPFAIVCSANP